MQRTGTDVQNFPPWAAILASLFARANDWELAFQIWKLSSLRPTEQDARRQENCLQYENHCSSQRTSLRTIPELLHPAQEQRIDYTLA